MSPKSREVPQHIRDLFESCARAVIEAEPKPRRITRRGKLREITHTQEGGQCSIRSR